MSVFIEKKRQPRPGQAVKNDEINQGTRKISNPIIKPIEKPGREPPKERTADRIASASSLEPMEPKSEAWGKRIDVEALKKEMNKPVTKLEAIQNLHTRRNYGLPRAKVTPPPEIQDINEVFDALKIEDVEKSTKEFTVKGLVPTLMDHQIAGVRFLRKRERDGNSGGFLCDDMGLGKTVQSIALILKNKPDKEASVKTTLVVSPLAVMYQWVEEIESKAPGLSVIAHQGPKRAKDVAKLEKYNVVVTTYDTLVSEFAEPEVDNGSDEKEDEKKSKRKESGPLYKMKFFRVIADEAHHFRNPKTKVSQAMADIQSEGKRWALTGTPVHNSVEDLYSLIRFIGISPYDKESTWKETIAVPIIKNSKEREGAVKMLKQLLSKYMIRREQKVIKLPTCRRHRELISFNTQEEENARILRSKLNQFNNPNAKAMKNLTLVLRMRQLCNDSSLIPKDLLGESKKKEAKEDSLDELSSLLEQVSISQPVSSESSKVRGIVDLIKKEPKRKTVLFSSFVQMLEGTAAALRAEGIQCRVYEGQLSADKRRTMLSEFRTDKSITVLLCSLTCAAVGLNITAASKVVMIDPWWNPMIADQAVNRVHRIGQTQEVDVHELAIKDSIEERIYDLQDRKRDMAVNLLERQEALSPDELHYLLYGTRREPAKEPSKEPAKETEK